MIDYDICDTTLYSAETFNKLMDSIGKANKFQNYDSNQVWITTSEVRNVLSTEFTIQDNKIIVAPQYILPTGEHTVILFDENTHIPNRAERRKKQKEARRGNRK